MGRTLSYRIPKGTPITDEQWDLMLEIQDRYTDAFDWTCEQLCLEPFRWYPRWPSEFRDSNIPTTIGNETTPDKAWDVVNQRWDELEEIGMGRLSILRRLEQEKLIVTERFDFDIHYEDGTVKHIPDKAGSGFTKVASNEWNALLVLSACIEMSKAAPQACIYLDDEGDFLAVPIYIKDGSIHVDMQKHKEQVEYWSEHGFEQCILKAEHAIETGKYIATVDPADFEDHPEFRTLNIGIGD